MKTFITKYIPEKQMAFYARKAGLSKRTVYNWLYKPEPPGTFALVAFVGAVAKHQKRDFDMLMLEALENVVKL